LKTGKDNKHSLDASLHLRKFKLYCFLLLHGRADEVKIRAALDGTSTRVQGISYKRVFQVEDTTESALQHS